MEDQNKESLSRQYLLRTLTESEMTRLEEEYFADNDAFEELEIAEDELIDAYLRNELSGEERKFFETSFLASPRLARRVELGKTLVQATSRQRDHQRADATQVIHQPTSTQQRSSDRVVKSWSLKNIFWPGSLSQRVAFAALVLIMVIGGAALFADRLRLQRETERLATARERLEQQNQELIAQNSRQTSETDRLAEALRAQQEENARLNDQVERNLNKPPQPATEIPILLFVSGSRGGGTSPRVSVPATPSVFVLKIALEADEYQRYSATIKTADERIIRGPQELKPSATREGKMLIWKLSSTRFTPDDYIVTVSGKLPSGKAEEIAAYTFRVSRNANR